MTLVFAFVDTCRFNTFRLLRMFSTPFNKGEFAASKSAHRIKEDKKNDVRRVTVSFCRVPFKLNDKTQQSRFVWFSTSAPITAAQTPQIK